ncbi:hypothetical protein LR48_Vigan04g057700 [Vigna angularis]|uniref:Uncharacterized protein n=1 Tax=Phaseolus angularis TaxID=3914 RepID=A0A0L9UCX8_PHAAN|nr:uncharacterized protein HKW66_Vig0083740 [Vigna angularis]KOM40379.1 hypothetical protein LR48_Vigan04g057700 [Vigna angularis]
MSQGSPLQDNKELLPEPDSHKDEATTNTVATATANAAPPAPTRNRPSRACNIRTAARLYLASQSARPKAAKREPRREESPQHCGGVSLSRCEEGEGATPGAEPDTYLMHHQGEPNTQS